MIEHRSVITRVGDGGEGVTIRGSTGEFLCGNGTVLNPVCVTGYTNLYI